MLQDILPALVACIELAMEVILKSIPALIMQIDAYCMVAMLVREDINQMLDDDIDLTVIQSLNTT